MGRKPLQARSRHVQKLRGKSYVGEARRCGGRNPGESRGQLMRDLTCQAE